MVFYDFVGIVLSFKNLEDVFFKWFNKVFIDKGQIECFFKLCNFSVQIKQELKLYKEIFVVGLDFWFNICYFYGIVMDDFDFVFGLLLMYIVNGDCFLLIRIYFDEFDDFLSLIREQWLWEVEIVVIELYKIGIVWGDVKVENVLIDVDDYVWVIDFGGGYIEGWVDEEKVGIVEGDL